MASISVAMAGDDSCAPLTALELTILDLLLKKKARAEAAAKQAVKAEPGQSSVKAVNPVGGPKTVVNPVGGLKTASQGKSATSSEKLRCSPELKQKAPKTTSDQDNAGGKADATDDFSEGPLNDEELDKLMREFNIGSGGEESQDSEEITQATPTPVVGRGRGQGRGRGRGRGRGGAGRGSAITRETRPSAPPVDLEESEDSSSKDSDSNDQNDPVMAGLSFLEKMSDDQVVRYMNTYKKEKKIGKDGKTDADDFAAWLSNKLQLSAIAETVPSSSRGRQSGKVGSEGKPPKRGASRGGGRGRGAVSKGRMGKRQSAKQDSDDES